MEGGSKQNKPLIAAIVAASSLFALFVLTALSQYRLEGSSSTLISFPNRPALERFLLANGLQESDLSYVASLGAYVVPRSEQGLKAIEAGMTIAPNRRYSALLTPNDPLYPQWYTDKVSAPTAWDITTGSTSVTVAVIDTGFALDHEDLAGRWATNAGEVGAGKETNGLDDDSNGYIDDWRGWDFISDDNAPQAGTTGPTSSYASHGTIVAGLVGATGNNGKGVASVNWGAKLLPIQALGDDGTGYTADVASAIRYAADRGAKVISLSLGSPDTDSLMRDQITYARNKGAVVIAAAGNGGCECMVYPANYSEVIAVGATDSNDNRAGFSSYGPNLDLMAPGSGTVRSPYWSSANQTTSYTTSASGTSMSTPIVSGTAALLLSLKPTATPDEVGQALTDGATKVAGMEQASWHRLYGYGRLNAAASITAGTTALTGPNGSTAVFRFWSPSKQAHFYTASQEERGTIEKTYNRNIWQYERVGFYLRGFSGSCPSDETAVYRFWSDSKQSHFYTSSPAERNLVVTTMPTWNYHEGARFCAPDSGTAGVVPVYRFWSDKLQRHFYTSSSTERDYVNNNLSNVWNAYEGVRFHAYQAP